MSDLKGNGKIKRGDKCGFADKPHYGTTKEAAERGYTDETVKSDNDLYSIFDDESGGGFAGRSKGWDRI
jgi:hypothetical protein